MISPDLMLQSLEQDHSTNLQKKNLRINILLVLSCLVKDLYKSHRFSLLYCQETTFYVYQEI